MTIDEMLNSREYQGFISDRLGNDLFLSDPDRADRMYEAAEDGCDGSTHAEVIEDWRTYAGILRDQAGEDDEQAQAGIDDLEAEIDACEKWHDENGSLNEQLG